ncbi:MAG: hypothetical protein LBK70_00730 [Clostridiales bacterium]|nr:hypothetical protein [Clostridiales bacterium]
MKLISTLYDIKCEIGPCTRLAKHSLTWEHFGAEHNMHACETCLQDIHTLVSQQLVNKSAKPKKS